MSPSTSTDRQLFRAAVAEIAAKAKEKLPECNGRVEAAAALVLAGDVELLDAHTAQVGSQTDPAKTYHVEQGVCTCQDFARAPHALCKHRLSVAMARRVLELVPQSPGVETEPAPAPLPEAPCSITLKASLHGYETLVTLRGTDFASVQAQVEQAAAWLKAQAPTPAGAPAQPTAARRPGAAPGDGPL